MNRQFFLLTASLLFSVLICCSACDLGTYNKRFEERQSQSAPQYKEASEEIEASESEAGDTDTDGESADAK